MARNGVRIRPFEAHSHFQSIANPPRPQIPPENLKHLHFSKNQKIRKFGNPPGSAAMGRAVLILGVYESCGCLELQFAPHQKGKPLQSAACNLYLLMDFPDIQVLPLMCIYESMPLTMARDSMRNKGALPIAADPGGFPDVRIFLFFRKMWIVDIFP